MKKILLLLLLIPSLCLSQGNRGMMTVSKQTITGSSYDADAQALFTAIEGEGVTISDGRKTNINAFFVTGKTKSYWVKMKGMHGLFFGDALGNKYNWIDPRDLDAAYRYTWHGSWTHGASGVQGDGSTAYADSHYVPADISNSHISFYSRTASPNTGNKWPMGESGGTGGSDLYLNFFFGNVRASLGTSFQSTAAAGDYSGYFVGTVYSGNGYIYQSASSLASTSASSVSTTYSLYLGAFNNSSFGAGGFSDDEIAFDSFGDGLSSSEVTDLNTDVETLLDAEGIGVEP